MILWKTINPNLSLLRIHYESRFANAIGSIQFDVRRSTTVEVNVTQHIGGFIFTSIVPDF